MRFVKPRLQGSWTTCEFGCDGADPMKNKGLAAMNALKDEGFQIEVFDRRTPLTDIVDMALAKK